MILSFHFVHYALAITVVVLAFLIARLIWPPLDSIRYAAFVAAVIVILGLIEALRGNRRALEARVAERTAELDRANATLQAEIAEREQLADELTALLAREAAARTDAERARRQAEALLSVARSANESLNLEQTLMAVVSAARQLFGADRAAVYYQDESGRHLCPVLFGHPASGVEQICNDCTVAPICDRVGKTWPPISANGAAAARSKAAIGDPATIAHGGRNVLTFPVLRTGEPTGFLAVYHDRPRAYTAEEMQAAQLLANQAAAAVANARLYEAERRAREALARNLAELARSNADLEQFATVASHDLQEPLRMISSYLQLLARRYQGKLDADADEFIGYAVEGASRMQALIVDLLTYARVGRKGEAFSPTDAGAALSAALANLRLAIDDSGAVVSRGDLPTVLADEVQLVQLFQNLIDNAIKFRSKAPPDVRVCAASTPEEWVFSVRDNGIGIDPEYHDRIFAIFRRLHSREEYPGTGIGLAVCKRIVERHGGRIWVESEHEKGATFCFSIPRREECQP
ncbi:MAG: GAF domain-containing protein [Chloroflexi bacterium]|nr:GAF domain-containing protein [Chloroflexota bacterium]